MGNDDAENKIELVPLSLFDIIYSPPEIEQYFSLHTKDFFGKFWKPDTFKALENRISNTETDFNFIEYMLRQPARKFEQVYSDYSNFLRQKKADHNHQPYFTHKLMNHLHQEVSHLYLNNLFNKENSHLGWELITYIDNLNELYNRENLLQGIVDMHELKADTYMMIGSAEKEAYILEYGLEEIKKAQTIKDLTPSARNVKGMIFQYLAALSNTEDNIKENINKSLYQFEKALNTEFDSDYIFNYFRSHHLAKNLGLSNLEDYHQRENDFLSKIKEKYPNVEIDLYDDDDEEIDEDI